MKAVVISNAVLNQLRNTPENRYDQLCVKRGQMLKAGVSMAKVDKLYPLPKKIT